MDVPMLTPPALDNHRFTLTSGAKFGGDFLAYPGDPALYHAQYTVRCVNHASPQHPLALAAATRMAHAARCASNGMWLSALPICVSPP
jgi:tRNA splicing endonuclease